MVPENLQLIQNLKVGHGPKKVLGAQQESTYHQRLIIRKSKRIINYNRKSEDMHYIIEPFSVTSLGTLAVQICEL